VQYFSLWATESADRYGIRDAIAILTDAAGRCFDEDMRQRRDVLDAFDYLSRETGHAVYLNRFRKALDEPSPAIRFRAAGDACKACTAGSVNSGASPRGPGTRRKAPGVPSSASAPK
jgi:hypothetical protein